MILHGVLLRAAIERSTSTHFGYKGVTIFTTNNWIWPHVVDIYWFVHLFLLLVVLLLSSSSSLFISLALSMPLTFHRYYSCLVGYLTRTKKVNWQKHMALLGWSNGAEILYFGQTMRYVIFSLLVWFSWRWKRWMIHSLTVQEVERYCYVGAYNCSDGESILYQVV